mmetsp:Transcript_30881/g.83664  ORF Transcript_30881/g.83664 Transcript_30881/m.83664 type:complete len:244 (+) Transcript_30881:743-1474(+)
MAWDKAAVSALSFAFFASFSVIWAVRLSTSSALASRCVTAAAISLSQKDLVVASALAWASSLLTRSLMMERTFSKWSSDALTLSAATESTGLWRLPAALSRSARTRCCLPAPPEARRWRSLPRSCRKDGALLPRCKPTSIRFACQLGATPVSSASMALLMAVISCARVWERSSQALAFASHCSVSVLMKAWSADLAPCSASCSPDASWRRSVLKASSFSFSSFSLAANFFSFSKPSFFLSKLL